MLDQEPVPAPTMGTGLLTQKNPFRLAGVINGVSFDGAVLDPVVHSLASPASSAARAHTARRIMSLQMRTVMAGR